MYLAWGFFFFFELPLVVQIFQKLCIDLQLYLNLVPPKIKKSRGNNKNKYFPLSHGGLTPAQVYGPNFVALFKYGLTFHYFFKNSTFSEYFNFGSHLRF